MFVNYCAAGIPCCTASNRGKTLPAVLENAGTIAACVSSSGSMSGLGYGSFTKIFSIMPVVWRNAIAIGKSTVGFGKGVRLADLIPRADAIKERRAKSIVRFLVTKEVRCLFEADDGVPDLLAVTSCGLLCGK